MMTAPGMPRPLGSVTLPVTVPEVVSCATAGVQSHELAMSKATTIVGLLMVEFLQVRDVRPARAMERWGETEDLLRRGGERRSSRRQAAACRGPSRLAEAEPVCRFSKIATRTPNTTGEPESCRPARPVGGAAGTRGKLITGENIPRSMP